MSTEPNNKSGPLGAFKVKLKSPGQDDTYLTSTDGGVTCKWSSTDTPLQFNGPAERDSHPMTWCHTVDGRSRYLLVSGTVVSANGDGSSSNWKACYCCDKLPYDDGDRVMYLGKSSTDGVILVSQADAKSIELVSV